MTGLTRAQSYQLLYNGEPVEDVLNKLQVSSIAQLRTINGGFKTAILTGYANIFDGGEGLFVWDAASTDTDDGGSIIGSGTTGRWKRVTDHYTPEMFGCKGNGVDDDAVNLNKCLAAAGVKELSVSMSGEYLCGSPITVPVRVVVTGNTYATIKRAPSMSTSLDFLTMLNGSSLHRVNVKGSRNPTQAPAEVVFVRIAANVQIKQCVISGSVGYGIVANAVPNVVITHCTFMDIAGACVALYGDGTANSTNAEIGYNTCTSMGAGSFLAQMYNFSEIHHNKVSGTYIGAPGDRTYVATNISGAVTYVSGQDFSSAMIGQFVVLPGGTEHRIVAKASATSLTVSPPPPSTKAKVRALIGTGDLLGIQSCENVAVRYNDLRNGVTYGTSGGTMAGNTAPCNYCVWEHNYIRNTGKNGINLSHYTNAAPINSCSITNNKLVQVGNGGRGTGDAYLLPDMDTYGILLLQQSIGYLNNTNVSNNEVITWTGDLNEGVGYFGLSGLDEGSVRATGNTQNGYADGYVRGDIIECVQSGYGAGATFGSFVSTGDSVIVSIITGTGPTAAPYFYVRKVIRTPSHPMVMAQMQTTTGNLLLCWGMQSSTPSRWYAGVQGTPSGTATYVLKA